MKKTCTGEFVCPVSKEMKYKSIIVLKLYISALTSDSLSVRKIYYTLSQQITKFVDPY